MGPGGGAQARKTDLGRLYNGYTVKLAPFIKQISLYHRRYQILGKSDNFHFLAIEGHGVGPLGPRGGGCPTFGNCHHADSESTHSWEQISVKTSLGVFIFILSYFAAGLIRKFSIGLFFGNCMHPQKSEL